MISGTSFDAVEALLVELEHDGEVLVCDLVEHRSVPYPRATHDSIAALLPPAASTIEQVCRLDVEIGQFFGTVAKDLVERHGPVDVVCSHGQTVYHWVEGDVARGTLQLGEPAWIAELTGAAVVSDVRNRDIACGGHGAPLASLLDVLLLGSQPSATSGSLNLGGIANVTVVGPDQPPIAFDIGPANALMDVFVHALTGGEESFDRDGALAARGKPDTYLVDRLLDDPYFSLPPPKSTGKEYFNFGYVSSRLPEGREITPEDLLASLTVASGNGCHGPSSLRPRRPCRRWRRHAQPHPDGPTAGPPARRPCSQDRRTRRTRRSQGGARVRCDRLLDAVRHHGHYRVLYRRGEAQRVGIDNARRGAAPGTHGPSGRRPRLPDAAAGQDASASRCAEPDGRAEMSQPP